jgi:predicted ferric reductase
LKAKRGFMTEIISYKRLLVKYILVIFTFMLLSLMMTSVALGRAFRLEKLPDKGKNFGCLTCHVVPGGVRNPFGKDYEKIAIPAGDIYTAELGRLDSDGDRFISDVEFTANTNPGDPNSNPKNKINTSIKGSSSETGEGKATGIGNYLYVIGRYLALIEFVLILFQYVLSSKIKLIEKNFGLDKLFSVHRKLGVLGLTLIFFHPILIYASTKLQGYNTLLKVIGVCALLTLIIGAGAAILYAKLHLKYETWKNIHRVNYIILPLAFMHSFFIGSDLHRWSILKFLWLILAVIYVIILIYKVWNWFHVRRHPFKVAEVLKETHDVCSLHFTGKHQDYKPGQFMIIQLVRNGKVSESHPFTIASSPTSDKLSVSVKSVGDFTSKIGDTKINDVAYIDEPYGRFSFLNYDAQNLVFIAGGIGVTPFISMLRYIYDNKLDRNVILMWANKTENDIAFKDELKKIESDMPSLKVLHIMSKQDDWSGEKGFVDAEKIKKYITNFQESQFYICGPPIMMTSVEKVLRSMGAPKKRIHYERFALR